MENRKFNLTCALIILNFGLLLGSKITGDMWIALCMAVLTIYVAGNVYQKKVTAYEHDNES